MGNGFRNFISRNVQRASLSFHPAKPAKPEPPEPKVTSLVLSRLILPPTPQKLLRNRAQYDHLQHRFVDPDSDLDTSLEAMYRIYEHIMLDQHLQIRNEFEAFWFHSSWKVSEIPDPRDPDPERYAVLACIPPLLCLAFNRRIELGLPRDAPPIFTHDQLDEWRAQERDWETDPPWCETVPPLQTRLEIPHWDLDLHEYAALDTFEDERASKQCERKNVLIWQPHIHFI